MGFFEVARKLYPDSEVIYRDRFGHAKFSSGLMLGPVSWGGNDTSRYLTANGWPRDWEENSRDFDMGRFRRRLEEKPPEPFEVPTPEHSEALLVSWERLGDGWYAPGWRDAQPGDELWFVCIQHQGQRCPFPFAIGLSQPGDTIPDWLTADVCASAIAEARRLNLKIEYCYPEFPPEVAREFFA